MTLAIEGNATSSHTGLYTKRYFLTLSSVFYHAVKTPQWGLPLEKVVAAAVGGSGDMLLPSSLSYNVFFNIFFFFTLVAAHHPGFSRHNQPGSYTAKTERRFFYPKDSDCFRLAGFSKLTSPLVHTSYLLLSKPTLPCTRQSTSRATTSEEESHKNRRHDVGFHGFARSVAAAYRSEQMASRNRVRTD